MIESFECKICDFAKEYPNDDSPVRCPKCGRATYTLRFIKCPRPKPNFVNIGYKDTPRYSASMGVSETQIEEAKRLHPQADWRRFGHSFRPLIKNRAEKKKMMSQCGMEEYDPKDFKGRD